jgi:hypothetical protein
MSRKESYFVSYVYRNQDTAWGFTSTVIQRELPVSGWDDIEEITNIIKSSNSELESIVILNWRRFEDPE